MIQTLDSWTGIFAILATGLLVFLIFRFFLLWYLRINKIVYELEQTNYILKQLFIQQGGTIEDVDPKSDDPLFKTQSK